MRRVARTACILGVLCLISLNAGGAFAASAVSGGSARLSGYVFLDGSRSATDVPNGMWDAGERGFAGVQLRLRLLYRKTADGPVYSYDWGKFVYDRQATTDANGYWSMTVDSLSSVSTMTMTANGVTTLRFPYPLCYQIYISNDNGHGLIGPGSSYYCTTDLADPMGYFLSKHGEDASRSVYSWILVPIPPITNPVFNWPAGAFPDYSTFMGVPGSWSPAELAAFQRQYILDPSTGAMLPNVRNHIDFGFWRPAVAALCKIGDYVWEDTNCNGIQDAGEPPVPGVTVRLLDAAGTEIGTAITDSNGKYLFDGLRPGDYRVQFSPPTSYKITKQNEGSDDAVDSDADPLTGVCALTNLSPAEEDMTWDCGLYRPAAIGDFVWDDKDADGVQDSGEPGIPGVTVELLDASGTVVRTMTTDAAGYYYFRGLMPGGYGLHFIAPSGYAITLQDRGADDKDSDADCQDGRTVLTTLEQGENDFTWDCGLYRPAAIGDFVWEDKNADGIQDSDEPGIAGVTVKLLDAAGNILATTTTDHDGYYRFTDLRPGAYAVQFVAPDGYLISPQDQGGNDAADSDANPSSGLCAFTILEEGETDLSWDCGVYKYPERLEVVKSGAKLWGDTRTPGFWKNNIAKAISGKNGWQVSRNELLVLLGQVQSFYRSDPFQLGATDEAVLSAAYAILDYGGSDVAQKLRKDLLCCELNLFSGIYALSDTDGQEGLCRYAEDVLNGVPGDMNALHEYIDWLNNAESRPQSPTLSVGDSVVYTLTIRADSYQPRTVTVRDYLDPSLTVEAVDAGGIYHPAGGYVEWKIDLPAGPYTQQVHVWVSLTATPNNTEGPSPGAGWTASNVVALDGCGTLRNKAWYTGDGGGGATCAIGDFVWEDTNHNGLQDSGEPGVANVSVALKRGSTIVATQVTGADGKYLFAGLTPGDYSLSFTLPSDYEWTLKDQGGNDATDSDVDSSGNTPIITLSANETDLRWDAGVWLASPESVTVSKTGAKLRGYCKTIGFWKTNISKALSGKTGGTQVPASDLISWLKAVRNVYRDDPYKNLLPLTSDAALLQAAYAILNYGGSDMSAKTLQQLLACELNYVSGSFIMTDTSAHLALIQWAEDLLNTPGADLSSIHDMLDQANNLGNGNQTPSITVGDTVVYTITLRSSLTAPRQVEVRDYLDSSLSFVYADRGGVFSGPYATWTVSLPAGDNVDTKLQLVVKVNSTPRGDGAGDPGTGWTSSSWCQLAVDSEVLNNRAWVRIP